MALVAFMVSNLNMILFILTITLMIFTLTLTALRMTLMAMTMALQASAMALSALTVMVWMMLVVGLLQMEDPEGSIRLGWKIQKVLEILAKINFDYLYFLTVPV